MEDWLQGSQVSKARPGAPFDSYRGCELGSGLFTRGVRGWLGFFQVFGTVFCKPGLVSVQERDCVFDVLLCRPMGGAFTVVRYQVLEFWTALNIHTARLPQSH